MQVASLDSLLPEDHRARLVWEYVRGTGPGRRCTSRFGRWRGGPDGTRSTRGFCMALWLYATLDGVGSARRVGAVVRGPCGLSVDLRRGVGELPHAVGLPDGPSGVSGRVADAERGDADARGVGDAAAGGPGWDAGAGQCRGGLVPAAGDAGGVPSARPASRSRRLRQELQADPAAGTRRQQAARAAGGPGTLGADGEGVGRVADDRGEAVGAKKDKARASTTDPEARVMKMADGGFRPAHNVELATDTASQVITAVDVVNTTSDPGQIAADGRAAPGAIRPQARKRRWSTAGSPRRK